MALRFHKTILQGILLSKVDFFFFSTPDYNSLRYTRLKFNSFWHETPTDTKHSEILKHNYAYNSFWFDNCFLYDIICLYFFLSLHHFDYDFVLHYSCRSYSFTLLFSFMFSLPYRMKSLQPLFTG